MKIIVGNKVLWKLVLCSWLFKLSHHIGQQKQIEGTTPFLINDTKNKKNKNNNGNKGRTSVVISSIQHCTWGSHLCSKSRSTGRRVNWKEKLKLSIHGCYVHGQKEFKSLPKTLLELVSLAESLKTRSYIKINCTPIY